MFTSSWNELYPLPSIVAIPLPLTVTIHHHHHHCRHKHQHHPHHHHCPQGCGYPPATDCDKFAEKFAINVTIVSHIFFFPEMIKFSSLCLNHKVHFELFPE